MDSSIFLIFLFLMMLFSSRVISEIHEKMLIVKYKIILWSYFVSLEIITFLALSTSIIYLKIIFPNLGFFPLHFIFPGNSNSRLNFKCYFRKARIIKILLADLIYVFQGRRRGYSIFTFRTTVAYLKYFKLEILNKPFQKQIYL